MVVRSKKWTRRQKRGRGREELKNHSQLRGRRRKEEGTWESRAYGRGSNCACLGTHARACSAHEVDGD